MNTTKHNITNTAEPIKPGYKKTSVGIIPEDWKVKRLGEIGVFISGNGFPIEEQGGKDGIPFYKVSDMNLKGNEYKMRFSNNYLTSKQIERLKLKPILKTSIIFAKVGAAIFLERKREAKTFLIDNNMMAFTPYKYNEFIKYVFDIIMLSKYAQVGALPSYNASDISSIKIMWPSFKEQTAIADCLSTWDKGIEKLSALIASKKEQKKGLMQQLLTGKKRLDGFTEEWYTKKIKEFSKEYSTRNIDNQSIDVLSCTKYDGLVPSLEYFGRKVYGDDLSKYKIVPYGYFAYATNHIEEGSIGYQDIRTNGLVSPMYTVFKTNEKINNHFLFSLLKSHKLIHEYNRRMEGSINRRGGLRWSNFKSIKVTIPSFEEQTAIAEILQTADKEIELLEKQLTQLELQKKGLMQVLLTGQKRLIFND